jgi:hypothetical protein
VGRSGVCIRSASDGISENLGVVTLANEIEHPVPEVPERRYVGSRRMLHQRVLVVET